MGGGGFMQHASDTNKKDRGHRKARREKFNGNFSEDTILNAKGSESIRFPELPEEQVELVRERIRELCVSRKRQRNLIFGLLLGAFVLVVVIVYMLLDAKF